jgi:hypothetical protein
MTELMKHTALIAEESGRDSKARPAGDRRLSPPAHAARQPAAEQSRAAGQPRDLLKEVAVFAERADIAEEIQRLTSHWKRSSSLPQSEHAGRKLDFIAQEMLREANTIASKANDAAIARISSRSRARSTGSRNRSRTSNE